MKKILLSLVLITGSLTAFGQMEMNLTTKAIAEDQQTGELLEVKSDLPSENIPEQMIIKSNGNVLTVDGVFIGVAVHMMDNKGEIIEKAVRESGYSIRKL